ncbi:AbrB/MazE/SpoVT family DNA-binding domain-containing protein [bacterium]|nr:MAG: AbrB/MazE/SpoVT family DNA-binding domain-containing protein [bacterium]
MFATIQKWGNSLAVRIPVQIAKDAHLGQNSRVEISLQGDEIVLKPVEKAKKYSLAELVARITPENVPGKTDMGPPAGKELL